MADESSTGFRLQPEPSAFSSDEFEPENPPQFSGPNLLFAIARDPHTLFTYWNVDWASEFAADEPQDRHVYLRVLKESGESESESLVEPMLGSFYAPVTQPRASYRTELGYYTSGRGWKSVAISETVTPPANAPSENTKVDVATVPFHITFQKLVDLFGLTNGDPLVTALSRLEDRIVALTERDVDLAPADREILRALNMSIDGLRAGRANFAERPNESELRRRAEAILGFGATSPSGGFSSSSSWS
jgi:hypothetical protein